jgi:methylmalonyl-CoA mutase
VTHIFSPADGQRMGLAPMVNTIIEACDVDLAVGPVAVDEVLAGEHRALARVITALEAGRLSDDDRADLHRAADGRPTPVLGVTGTGGSGKSSLTDELIRRFRLDHEDKLHIAVLAVDPTRRRGGGALLGDRIRMNAIDHPGIYMRSLATRGAREIPECLPDVVTACRAAGYDLVIVETPGIGQGDAAIVPLVDVALYVMTPEFGAASQLEKIDMLDFADAVAINKFDRRGAQDAFRDVKRQLQRNRSVTGGAFGASTDDDVPVFGTVAALFNDDGVTGLYQHLRDELQLHGLSGAHAGKLAPVTTQVPTGMSAVVPPARTRYLAEAAEAGARLPPRHRRAGRGGGPAPGAGPDPGPAGGGRQGHDRHRRAGGAGLTASSTPPAVACWRAGRPTVEAYSGDEHVVTVRDREIHTVLHEESLAGTAVPKVALPRFSGDADLLRWLRSENLPGSFPFTGGVFAFKREGESPTRMFAGEGEAARTNRRFHLLAEGQPATRLSTAFDSVTLYGFDPGRAPDIYGKVGNSGASIATLDA